MSALQALRRFARPGAAPPRAGAACEICAAELPQPHRHVLDLKRHALACACGACAALFVDPGAGAGRYRTVPDRVRSDPAARLDDAAWAALGIPVALAFLVRGASGRWTAFLPGAAGAVEAELPDGAAGALRECTALAAAAEADVEALLLHRPRGQARITCLLVPVSACYELAGRLRQRWRGFDGGDEVRREVAAAVAALGARSRPLASPRGGAR